MADERSIAIMKKTENYLFQDRDFDKEVHGFTGEFKISWARLHISVSWMIVCRLHLHLVLKRLQTYRA